MQVQATQPILPCFQQTQEIIYGDKLAKLALGMHMNIPVDPNLPLSSVERHSRGKGPLSMAERFSRNYPDVSHVSKAHRPGRAQTRGQCAPSVCSVMYVSVFV